jgi:glucose/arabinose dehydrogenase
MRRAGLIALAAGVLVTACGSGDSGRAAAPSATATKSAAPAATETAAPQAQASRGARLKRIGDFSSPVYLTAPPGDRRRVFVVEQGGTIQVVVGGKRRATPFLDIRGQVTSGGEQGLLSMAFAPDYADSGRFYVYFTDRSGDQRVVEYTRAGADRADAGSARLVLRMADSESNHNGGLLLFGPDNQLYIGTGDGGGAGDQHGPLGNAQNLGSALGKLLRIDPAESGGKPYTVPSENPFVGRNGARPEVYAYGLRNPWRFTFDRKTGDLAIADVGQNEVEEIDFVRRGKGRGANFGWRPFEGNSRYAGGERAPGHIRPVITRTHGNGWCSITGGVVVRDRSLSGLRGRYLFGDICKSRIYSAKLSPGRATGVGRTSMHIGSVSSFGEDARGRVYAVSLNGPVYRLVPR